MLLFTIKQDAEMSFLPSCWPELRIATLISVSLSLYVLPRKSSNTVQVT